MNNPIPRLSLTIFALSILILGPAISGTAASFEEQALARVGDDSIALSDFNKEMAKYGGSGKEALLERMIDDKAVLVTAKKTGYENDPEIKAAVDRLIINKYLGDRLEPQLAAMTVSDEEIRSCYERRIEEFTTSAKLRVAIIRINVPRRADKEKRTEFRRRAEAAREEALRLGPETLSFGSVAVKYSDDKATRYRGGNTGWLIDGEKGIRWGAKVANAIFKLEEIGRVSEVIESEDGFYILKLMERSESSVRPLSELKDGVKYLALKEKRKKYEMDFMENLKKKLNINIDYALLETIREPSGGLRPAPPALPRR